MALGVSNFRTSELNQLLEFASNMPHGSVDVVQDWFDPLHQQRELRQLCSEHNIAFQAYSTLSAPGWRRRQPDRQMILEHPAIVKIATTHKCSSASVVLTWAIRRGVSVVPRSTNSERLAQNLAILPSALRPPPDKYDDSGGSPALTSVELDIIDSLDGTEGNPYG